MTASNQEPLQLIQNRQAAFTRAQLSAIYEYATDLPVLSDDLGDAIGSAIITELLDAEEEQTADEVFRRLERVVCDVISFSRMFDAIYYDHLEVEGKLEDINQILSTLTEAPLDKTGLNQTVLAQVPEVDLQQDAGDPLSLSLHDPNYVIVNTSKTHLFSTRETSYYHVLPGEEPRTFGTLDSLVEAVASLIDEHGHVLGQSLQVYRLCPIPEPQLSSRVGNALKDLEAD